MLYGDVWLVVLVKKTNLYFQNFKNSKFLKNLEKKKKKNYIGNFFKEVVQIICVINFILTFHLKKILRGKNKCKAKYMAKDYPLFIRFSLKKKFF
jgi:hypothetical protein